MRSITLFLLLGVAATVMIGCAANPAAPDMRGEVAGSGIPGSSDGLPFTRLAEVHDGPYRLWGEWTLEFSAEHDSVEVIPQRNMHFHLNTLKFLEQYCSNCLKVISLKNNHDGTVDLTVRVTHPFRDHLEYTAFDVKGIMMFSGSYEYCNRSTKLPLPSPVYVSWAELGDPEVLNADGYTPRWSPNWDSGSNLPIFRYWPGRFSFGSPNADINAYLDFYTEEERHAFLPNRYVDRTYHISLPPGKPVAAGYAVEACWEPPTVSPVTDPINDFPSSANQPEPYYFRFVINNGEVITDCDECCGSICAEQYMEIWEWGEDDSNKAIWEYYDCSGGIGFPLMECDPLEEHRFACHAVDSCHLGNGKHRIVAYCMVTEWNQYFDIAYTISDFQVNDPDLD